MVLDNGKTLNLNNFWKIFGILQIQVLVELGVVNRKMLASIDQIPLTVLKRSATIRHGSTKWKKGCQFMEHQMRLERFLFIQNCLSQAGDLTEVWVMYHELIHACGYVRHDRTFRKIEACWPEKASKALGKYFTTYLRSKKYEWNWTCPSCNSVYLRQRKVTADMLVDIVRRYLSTFTESHRTHESLVDRNGCAMACFCVVCHLNDWIECFC